MYSVLEWNTNSVSANIIFPEATTIKSQIKYDTQTFSIFQSDTVEIGF